MDHYIIIGFSLFLGTLFVGGAIILSKLLAFHTPGGERKVQPYECSEDPIAAGEIPSINASTLFVEMSIFIFILFFGLVYAWKKGVLVWE